jgi:hypothetical protein
VSKVAPSQITKKQKVVTSKASSSTVKEKLQKVKIPEEKKERVKRTDDTNSTPNMSLTPK